VGKKPSRWSVAAGLAVLAFALAQSNDRLTSRDTDMFYHLACGRYFCTQGFIPDRDPLSHTGDNPWVAFQWLWQVFTYGVYQLGGLSAVVAVRSALVALNTWLAYVLIRAEMPTGALASLVAWNLAAFTIMVERWHYLPRPHLIGYTLFLLFWLAFQSFRRRPGPRFIWQTLGLTAVWVNVHGSFMLVPVLLGAWLVLSVFSKPQPGERRWLSMALAAGVVGSFLNPQGLRIVLHPFYWVRPNVYTRTLEEYAPLDFLHANVPYAQLVVVGAVLMIGLRLYQRNWPEAGLLAALLRMSVFSVRHLLVLTYVLLPMVAQQLGRLRRNWDLHPRVERLGLLACLPGACLLAIQLMAVSQDRIAWETYPRDAVAYMRAAGLPGPLFHQWAWGGWLTWEFPEQKVFIDGRSFSVYSERVYTDYLNIDYGGKQWRELLDKYHIRLILAANAGELQKLLEGTSRWKQVYRDSLASVWIRADDAEAAALAGKVQPNGPQVLAEQARVALEEGRVEEARALLEQSLRLYPADPAVLTTLGMVQGRLGQPERAREYWAAALEIEPLTPGAHYGLAVYHLQRGETKEALRELEREEAVNPGSPQARALRETMHK